MKFGRAAVVVALVVTAGVAASTSPADARPIHPYPWPTSLPAHVAVHTTGAWWCGAWLLVHFSTDVEYGSPSHPVVILDIPDDGHARLEVLGHSGRFGPRGVGVVDVTPDPWSSPGEGQLHAMEGGVAVQSSAPSDARAVFHGVPSNFTPIKDGCPA